VPGARARRNMPSVWGSQGARDKKRLMNHGRRLPVYLWLALRFRSGTFSYVIKNGSVTEQGRHGACREGIAHC